ncbi:MAG: hypothetical protein CV045_06245 [Cyanobacteria bacterium M5B4]|nr:hypothetical protein [Cyanobacteria bacterium KgW148]PLS68718.1 MAG: hypothetical protein CV045_06245 [Cyanobacteria bacterium M5B4]
MIWMILCLHFALSAWLGWLAWQFLGWRKSIRRASFTLERWIKVVAQKLPIVTHQGQITRQQLLRGRLTYNQGQQFLKFGALLLSLGQWWRLRHGKGRR